MSLRSANPDHKDIKLTQRTDCKQPAHQPAPASLRRSVRMMK